MGYRTQLFILTEILPWGDPDTLTIDRRLSVTTDRRVTDALPSCAPVNVDETAI